MVSRGAIGADADTHLLATTSKEVGRLRRSPDSLAHTAANPEFAW
jgi:hypothetical protein